MNARSETDEPPPLWYSDATSNRFFGNMRVHYVASALYLLLASVPAYLLHDGQNMKDWVMSGLGMAWAIAVSLAYPSWCWLEARSFERWVRSQPMESRPR